MPRYYCDYCDTYLTHDSPSVRKQHNAGYKHKANVRSYYQQFEEQQTQSLIDQKVKEHLGQAAFQQVGVAFHQHMTTMQSGPYRPPIAVPVLPVPGTSAPVRPPVLPRPLVPSPGYGMLPTLRPPAVDSNGLPGAPSLAPPGAPCVRPPVTYSSSNGSAPSLPSLHQPVSSSSSYGNFLPSVPSYSQQGALASAVPTQYNAQQSTRPLAPLGPPGETTLAYGSSTGPGANQSTSYAFTAPGVLSFES